MFVSPNVRHVPNAELRGSFADPGLVAAEDDLHVRAEVCPALDRVSLDHAGVVPECFGHGEEGEKKENRKKKAQGRRENEGEVLFPRVISLLILCFCCL